jgi:GT2 family glycosyltransferase
MRRIEGFAGGNNVAIRHALHDPQTDYVLVLNNDVVVEPDFLDHMIVTATQRGAAMVSPFVLSLADRNTVGPSGHCAVRGAARVWHEALGRI